MQKHKVGENTENDPMWFLTEHNKHKLYKKIHMLQKIS